MSRRSTNVFDQHDENDLPTPVTPQHLLVMQEEQDARAAAAMGAAIVRSLASFLTVSDAQSITSGFGLDTPSVSENWVGQAGGTPFQWGSMAETPPTPAVVAISPTLPYDELSGNDLQYRNDDDLQNSGLVMEDDLVDDYSSLRHRRNTWAQERIADAVFSHPAPLRDYCVEAYRSAREVKMNQSLTMGGDVQSPETLVEPSNPPLVSQQQGRRQNRNQHCFGLHHLFNNVPVSVTLDVLGGVREVSLDTSFAALRITSMTTHGIVDASIRLLGGAWHGATHFNPLVAAQGIISRPFNAMGKTTEVVVSGIQSVATGVGSASSLAFHRLSAKTVSSSNIAQQAAIFRTRLGSPKAHKKLIRKLSMIHSAASVIRYEEIADDTGGLSKRMKSRVQRMLHYDVSLRPFVATVKLPTTEDFIESTSGTTGSTHDSGTDGAGHELSNPAFERSESRGEGDDASGTSSPESPFMLTPLSFPTTPNSRRMVLARGTRFADDVIFLARDHLRLNGALESDDERTREMAMALMRGRRLAVFDADDASAGIELSCGRHVATKVGSMLYCSIRSMVPILRNCFVYFEMSVLPKPSGNLIPQASMATLSIGLSTKEMPSNTLVGAWKGSVGICTTGQMLTAGQWCSPVDPSMSSYGDRATVGCLVCLDDGSAYETWEGMSVTAAVTFSVNQQIVSPPVSTLPMASATVDTLVTNLPTPVGSPTSVELNAPSRTPPLRIGPSPPSFTLPLLVPAEEELYPTVTLHSPGTAVMCRFSLGDVLATSRSAIGAPSGVAVYAIDGSLILSEMD